jgi:hypothetical protein
VFFPARPNFPRLAGLDITGNRIRGHLSYSGAVLLIPRRSKKFGFLKKHFYHYFLKAFKFPASKGSERKKNSLLKTRVARWYISNQKYQFG